MVDDQLWLGPQDDPDRLADPDVRSVFAYWSARCGDDMSIPSRADVDPPIDLPRLLPTMILFDVEPGPSGHRFRYRLVGSDFSWRADAELTGRRIDEVFPESDIAPDLQLYETVIARRHCVFNTRVSLVRHRQEFERYSRLIMPLARAGTDEVGLIWIWIKFHLEKERG